MVISGDAKKLKIIIGEDDIVYKRPLFEAIVFAAHKYQMAGITVTKGLMSYGSDSIVTHKKRIDDKSRGVPIILELIDIEKRIYDFSEIATKLLGKAHSGGILFVESVDVIAYKASD